MTFLVVSVLPAPDSPLSMRSRQYGSTVHCGAINRSRHQNALTLGVSSHLLPRFLRNRKHVWRIRFSSTAFVFWHCLRNA